MATVSFPRMLPAALVPPAVRLVRVQALRDGEITPDVKVARFFYEPTAAELGAVFVLDDGYSREQRYSTAVDRTWMVIAVDLMAPARVEAAFVSISDDITITLDLSAGAPPAACRPSWVRGCGSTVSPPHARCWWWSGLRAVSGVWPVTARPMPAAPWISTCG